MFQLAAAGRAPRCPRIDIDHLRVRFGKQSLEGMLGETTHIGTAVALCIEALNHLISNQLTIVNQFEHLRKCRARLIESHIKNYRTNHIALLGALFALRNSLEGKETPAPIDGYTAEQRFYLSYATLWAQNIRDEEIARLTKVDVHSLGKNRVNATLRNIEDFYNAFSVEDGAMFMPVEERVVIW